METSTLNTATIDEMVIWDDILESLDEEKCIICVGPGILTEPGKERIESQLANYLKSQEDSLNIRVYEDGWFHYLPFSSEVNVWKRIKEFYSTPRPWSESLMDKIARIPFHFVLSFTPDYKLRNAFTRQELPANFESFVKKVPPTNKIIKPTRNLPLVFNMLGELDKRNSLVMTYNDFYTYLESTFDDNSMADVLKEDILEADYFIFLGMPFDKWYTHLFMRILKQHSEKQSSTKYAANIFIDEHTATHCHEQYIMTFVSEGIEQFVDILYEKCKQTGRLRKAVPKQEIKLPFDTLQQLVIQNNSDKFFEVVLISLNNIIPPPAAIIEKTLLLQGRWEAIKKKKIAGTLIPQEENQLRYDLIKFITELKTKFPPNGE